MSGGFFSVAQQMRKTESRIPHCGSCGLSKTCNSPKMEPTGDGKKRVLIVAESPGKEEDRLGVHLVGESGQLLRKTLATFGVDLDRDCVKTNAILCHLPKGVKLKDRHTQACLPNLKKTIAEVDPFAIIPLGGTATKAVLDQEQKDTGSISKWAGFRIPSQKPNAWICPTYHPAFVLRMDSQVLERLWRKHLLRAFARTKKRPWEQLPEYEKKVDSIFNLQDAADAIRRMAKRIVLTAFDYETNMLKPDPDEAKIYSCSIAQDNYTIAFPWDGPVIPAMKELLRNESPKVASNLKFEERWTRKEFGLGVRNWHWDTMLAAHVADNRPGITSIKFLSHALLGADVYSTHIEPYFKSDETGLNQIHKIPIKELLLYNGLDSLFELLVAKKQMRKMGVV